MNNKKKINITDNEPSSNYNINTTGKLKVDFSDLKRILNDLPNLVKKHQTDSIVEEVRQDLLNRSKIGVKKYGITLDRKDLTLKEWLQHALEECYDQALYLKRAIKELK